MHRVAPQAEDRGGGGAAQGRGGIRKTIANISIRNKEIRVGDSALREGHGSMEGQADRGRG